MHVVQANNLNPDAFLQNNFLTNNRYLKDSILLG